jgi:hypothetical protein
MKNDMSQRIDAEGKQVAHSHFDANVDTSTQGVTFKIGRNAYFFGMVQMEIGKFGERREKCGGCRRDHSEEQSRFGSIIAADTNGKFTQMNVNGAKKFFLQLTQQGGYE